MVEVLSKCASSIPLAVFERLEKRAKKPNFYPPYCNELCQFCLNLHFVSPNAYR